MKLTTLFSLIACNVIWSAHPAMGKLILEDVSPATAAWLRYSSALLAYLIAIPLLRARMSQAFAIPRRAREWGLAAGLGFMAFCFSPLLQMTGLEGSRATDNSLIIAMEPMMTVTLAVIFLGERVKLAQLMGFALAIGGFALLSGLSPSKFSSGFDSHLASNLILLLSLTGEASYSIFGRKLMETFSPMKAFGTACVFGGLFLTLAVFVIRGPSSFLEVGNLSWRGMIAVLWLGPLGTTATYLYWMFALSQAPIASITLTLFVQPVCGALLGYLFLADRLSFVQALGGVLILIAVFAQTVHGLMRASKPSAGGAR